MATKSNKFVILQLFVCLSFSCFSQVKVYSNINADSISIGQFKYGYDLNKMIQIFGYPLEKFEYEDPFPLDGYGKSLYFQYDSMKVTFVEFLGKIILSKISIFGGNHSVQIGSSSTIKIGGVIDDLRAFSDSYNYYRNQYTKPNKEEFQYFYFNLVIKTIDYESHGLISIKLKNEIIDEISIRFDEGT